MGPFGRGVAGRFAAKTCWLLVLGVGMLVELSPAAAAEKEVRDFNIWVDGKPVGKYQMTIMGQADGSLAMKGTASVKVGIFYKYSYEGQEVWKKGRLQAFRSWTNDNGKKYQVTARAEAKGLSVRVGSKEQVISADAWVTTYWQLPLAKFRNGAVPLLDHHLEIRLAGSLLDVILLDAQVTQGELGPGRWQEKPPRRELR